MRAFLLRAFSFWWPLPRFPSLRLPSALFGFTNAPFTPFYRRAACVVADAVQVLHLSSCTQPDALELLHLTRCAWAAISVTEPELLHPRCYIYLYVCIMYMERESSLGCSAPELLHPCYFAALNRCGAERRRESNIHIHIHLYISRLWKHSVHIYSIMLHIYAYAYIVRAVWISFASTAWSCLRGSDLVRLRRLGSSTCGSR
jgi:hypothetical protein